MRFSQILKIFSILTALLLCLCYPAVWGKDYTFTLHKELLTQASPSLRIQNTSGEIRIESHPENKIIIDAFKVVEADDSEKAKRIADEIDVIIKSDDSKIEIKTRYPSKRSKGFWRRLFSAGWGRSAYVDYHISAPERTKLDISSTSGDVIISDISGGIEVNATSGDLRIKRAKGDLRLETTSGDVEILKVEGDVTVQGTSSDLEIFDVTGDVEISSTSGNTSAENVVGLVKIDKTSGDVSLRGIKGEIRASSSSGDMIIEQLEGGLDLETSSGDIEVKTKISPQYDYYSKTSSGYIDFSLPENSDAQITLKTSSGSIKSKLPLTMHTISRNQFEGELGSGGPEIHLVTSSGDIELREYKR